MGDLRKLLVFLVATRLLLTGIGLVSRGLLQERYGTWERNVYSSIRAFDLWGQWDTGWYLSIAQRGYGEPWTPGEVPKTQTRYGFFPLYPLLMAVAGWPTGDPFLGGLLVSNLALAVSCFLLYRYSLLSGDPPQTACAAVLFLVAFPTSFVLSSVLSEPLALALLVGTFYLARGGRWWWAGAAGFALALARPTGALVALPLAVEYACRRRACGRRLGADAFALALPLLGALAFCAYLWMLTGDFWTYARAKAVWGRGVGFWNPVQAILAPWLLPPTLKTSGMLFGALLSLGCLAALAVGWKRITASERLLVLLFYLPFITWGPNANEGVPRYLTTAFPLYLLFARGMGDRAIPFLLFAFFLLQGFAFAFWSCGFPLSY